MFCFWDDLWDVLFLVRAFKLAMHADGRMAIAVSETGAISPTVSMSFVNYQLVVEEVTPEAPAGLLQVVVQPIWCQRSCGSLM